MVEKRGNAWCTVHSHPQKSGSTTDKPKGSIIKCYEFTPGDMASEARAHRKAQKMHIAIRISEEGQ